MHTVEVPISIEIEDKIILDFLLRHYEYVKVEAARLKEMGHLGYPDEKKLAKSIKRVIRYCTTQDEFNELGL
jgi:hypothetical protein